MIPSKPAFAATQRSLEPAGAGPSSESTLDSTLDSEVSDSKGSQTLPSGDGGDAAEQGSATEALDAPATPSVSAEHDCLTDDEILEYGHGQASAALLARIDAHLDRCKRCQELVDLVVADQREHDATPSQVTTFHEGFIVAGRYRVERFVGRGGMGEVYAAYDKLTGKHVALKTVLCTVSDDPRAIRKLFAEVLNAQRVAHPHVFKIYDLHEHRDDRRGRVPFFTMEYLEGETLGKRLRREGALPFSEARAIAEQLLAGLSAAHERGVLHLDFKSDNVMLRRTASAPDAVIMDFGLSRAADGEARQHTSERLQAAGTMSYMALEQLECRRDLDAAADVYAFGVVLYEMLSGQLPFRGESLSAMLLKQLTEKPVPLTRIVPKLSPRVEAFVAKCLQRPSSERFPNAGAALAALSAIEHFERAPRASRPSRGLLLLALMGAIGAIGAAAVWRTVERGGGLPRAEPTVAALEQRPLTLAPPSVPTPPHAAAQDAREGAPDAVAGTAGRTAPIARDTQKRLPAPGRRDVTRKAGTSPAKKERRSTPATEPSAPATEPPATEPPATEPPAPPALAAPAPPQGWKGPPPKAVPRPLPL